MTFSHAQRLPSMLDQREWLGIFSAHQRRDFQFTVDSGALCTIYLMKSRKERASHSKMVKIYTEIVVENNQGKQYSKRLKDDEVLTTTMKPGLDHEEVVYTAETTGDAKVQVMIKYDGDRIIMDGKILDRGTLKDDKIYFCFKVMMPEFYRTQTYGDDKDKAKAKMKRDHFRITRPKDRKPIKLKVYEEYDFSSKELAADGISKLEVEMTAQEDKEFIFSTLDGKGVLQLENRKKGVKAQPWKGYYVKWYRPLKEEKGKEIKPLVIEIK